MAKQKPGKSEGGNEKKKREYASAPVHVKPDLADKIAVIVHHDKVKQADFLDARLRDWVQGHYERVIREKNERLAQEQKDNQG